MKTNSDFQLVLRLVANDESLINSPQQVQRKISNLRCMQVTIPDRATADDHISIADGFHFVSVVRCNDTIE